ncbi:hypothetical protein B0H15DRAFT_795937 [Mycena belliarum]|uniref:Uncharacterized protein n=1 Tax=Mycena belliarum TaxID=1033014 RepID=A0AAD6UJJ8_9AGAR|nr:hypothetical protein B0H15DRAFT_795937 [Mycena belliae]
MSSSLCGHPDIDAHAVLEPRLPPDLERTIFEVAARSDPPTALRIMLVAQRARAWTEPLLYRTLTLCQSSWRLPSLLRALDAQPWRCAWVRALHIAPYIAQNAPCIARVVARCANLEEFVDRSYGRTPAGVLPRGLRRLCVALDTLDFPSPPPPFPALSFGPFPQLTHLHLLDSPTRWRALPLLLPSLPALTYLALHNYKSEIRAPNALLLGSMLSCCPRLRALVVFVPLHLGQEDNERETHRLVNDARFVILDEAYGLFARWELWDGEGSAPVPEALSYRAGKWDTDAWAPVVGFILFIFYLHAQATIGHSPEQESQNKTAQQAEAGGDE